MAQTAQNDSNTQLCTAVGTVTAFNLVVTATTLIAMLPLQSATSGNTFVAKVLGRVGGVTKSTSTAFLANAPLSITTAGVALAANSTNNVVNAHAANDAAAGDATMDVDLCAPTVF